MEGVERNQFQGRFPIFTPVYQQLCINQAVQIETPIEQMKLNVIWEQINN